MSMDNGVVFNIQRYAIHDGPGIQAAKHAKATGQDNLLILENAKKISKLKPMRVRVPLIPGFNDSVEAVDEIADFVRNELGCPDLDLLPYNQLGEIKYDFLDKTCLPLLPQNDGHLRMLESIIRRQTTESE